MLQENLAPDANHQPPAFSLEIGFFENSFTIQIEVTWRAKRFRPDANQDPVSIQIACALVHWQRCGDACPIE